MVFDAQGHAGVGGGGGVGLELLGEGADGGTELVPVQALGARGGGDEQLGLEGPGGGEFLGEAERAQVVAGDGGGGDAVGGEEFEVARGAHLRELLALVAVGPGPEVETAVADLRGQGEQVGQGGGAQEAGGQDVAELEGRCGLGGGAQTHAQSSAQAGA